MGEKTKKAPKDKKLKQVSKKSLRTMRKNRKRHIVREKVRVVKYGTKGFSRNIWLSMAATVVMAITLIILFVTVVASVILTNTAQLMKDKIDITIYFKPGLTEETLDSLTEMMESNDNVKSIEVSSSEQEYEKLLEENKDKYNLANLFDGDQDVLMDELNSTMRIKVYDIDNLDSVKAIVEKQEGFAEYVDDKRPPTYDVNRAEINTITSWASIARTSGIVLAIVFLVISILIIFSTIRMAIFSRREEIYMMKLVGADKSFIRGPFLIEAELCGIIAGVVAGLVSYFGFIKLAPKLAGYGIDVSSISSIMQSQQVVLVFLTFIAVGVLIGRVSARLAVSKYLHKT
jgi:cell division transport system permease protein